MAAFIDKFSTNKHYQLAMFRNGISKNKISSYKGTMNNGTPLSSSDYEMESEIKKNRSSTFEKNEYTLLFY